MCSTPSTNANGIPHSTWKYFEFLGIPKPSIQWTKNDEPINRSVGRVLTKKWSIVLEDLVPKDSGSYTCKVCNPHDCITHTYKLIVQGKSESILPIRKTFDQIQHSLLLPSSDRFPARPYIMDDYPKNITVPLNATATFSCQVIEDIATHITWAKYRAANDSDGNFTSSTLRLEVKSENLKSFVCRWMGLGSSGFALFSSNSSPFNLWVLVKVSSIRWRWNIVEHKMVLGLLLFIFPSCLAQFDEEN